MIAGFFDLLMEYVYYYPLFMAYLWMMGAIYYYYRWERKAKIDFSEVRQLEAYPRATILIPCFNEGENVRETLNYTFRQDYPNLEVIAINDGSVDNTGKVLDDLIKVYPKLRVIHLKKNQGKAIGLKTGAMASRSEYLICIDGDAILDPHAVSWIMWHFVNYPRVAAITGNPRIRTRSSLLGKIQVGEFSAIIGLMKRAQRIYGRLFTVSGVVSGFRKTALHQIGYWSPDMVTEDIDVSWKLQLNHWEIRFEPNALCWILMPETLRGLFKQRLRWAQGAIEVLYKNFTSFFSWRKRRMWPIMIEYSLSVFWAYSVLLVIVLWILGNIVDLPAYLRVDTIVPGWTGLVLALTCMLQFAISIAIDSRYEKGLGKFYYWMIWYPIAFWFIQVVTVVVALPKALLKRRGKRAVWISPDRGLRQ